MSATPLLHGSVREELPLSRSNSVKLWLARSRENEEMDEYAFGPGKREYYRRQHSMQDAVKHLDKILAEEAARAAEGTPGEEAEEEAEQEGHEQTRFDRIVVPLSNYVNVILFCLKLYASIATSSLAIIASTLDSLLDILAGAILWYTASAMAHHDPVKFPVGKRRMQPVGIMIFAAIMATLGFQILVEGVRALFAGPPMKVHVSSAVLHWVVFLLSAVVIVKLILFLVCRTSKNDIVQAYAADHFFDVITNAVGLMAAVVGNKLAWWVDPCGAIIIALYTIVNWSSTVLENAESLIGLSASPELLAKIVDITLSHDTRILKLESIKAWLLGSQSIVEVNILLPSLMPLKEAHAVGESLQNKLEAIPEVERAFVHLDHEGAQDLKHNGRSMDPV